MKTASISIGIIIILLAAVLIGAIVIILYRRRANRVLQGERSGAHTSIPAPTDTINGLFKIVTVVLLVWVCISMGRLSSIQSELETLKSLTQSNSFNLSGEMDRIKDEMKDMNSRVFSYSSSAGKVDTSDNTCIVKHTVKLKTFSDDTEVVFIAGNGTEVKMEKTGEGRYEAEVKTGLFEEYDTETGITIKENGVNVFEELQDERFYGMSAAYWQMFIPSLMSEFGIDTEYNTTGLNIRNINMFSNYKGEYHIASAKVIMEKNGTEIDSIDALDSFNEAYGEIIIPVDKEYTMAETDTIDAKLILVTEEGYTLEQLLFDRKDGRYITYGNRFTITDKNGKQVLSR